MTDTRAASRRPEGGTCARPARDGVSLVEVMVAIVILAIIVTSLAGASLAVAMRGRDVSGRSVATGLLTQEVDRAVAVPIESLAVELDRTTLDTPVVRPWPFARRIAVAGRADSLTVTISILPLTPAQRADSAVQSVLRTR